MKNIHILPTYKETRLFIADGKLFNYHKHQQGDGVKVINQHIYITSDEEIIEGVDQWYLDKFLNRPYNSGGAQYFSKQDVIIMTTDQDLIKDGVQAIDDEFLEWFVNNPSCEEIEVEKLPYDGTKSITKYWGGEYKITIPKEESFIEYTNTNDCTSMIYNSKEEPKQETLEEANFKVLGTKDDTFYNGAKWQQEQDKNKYSEEEVLNFTQTIIQQYKLGNTNIEQLDLLKETLQQFKNK